MRVHWSKTAKVRVLTEGSVLAVALPNVILLVPKNKVVVIKRPRHTQAAPYLRTLIRHSKLRHKMQLPAPWEEKDDKGEETQEN